jgi:DNA repair protein RadC
MRRAVLRLADGAAVHAEPAPFVLVPDCILAPDDAARLGDPLTKLVGRIAAGRILAAGGATALRMPAEELVAVARVPLKIAERVAAAGALATIVTAPLAKGTSASAIARHLPAGFALAEVEYLLAVALTAQNRVKAVLCLSKGGATGTVVGMRDIFRPLARLGAAAFVLAHNHPGGDPAPSDEDVELTNEVARAGLIVGIELVDHLVVATGGTVSFHDTGLMPTARELDRATQLPTFVSSFPSSR